MLMKVNEELLKNKHGIWPLSSIEAERMGDFCFDCFGEKRSSENSPAYVWTDGPYEEGDTEVRHPYCLEHVAKKFPDVVLAEC